MAFSTKMLNAVGVFLLATAVVSAGGTAKNGNSAGHGPTHQSPARAYGLHKLTTLRPRNHAVLPRRAAAGLAPRQDSGCEHHGPGYESCGIDGCYDPSIHVCCNDGLHCDVGQVCIDGTDWCCPEENPNCMDEGTDDDIDIGGGGGGDDGCSQWGPSYESCGVDGCYDPSIHVCCNDGLHCDVGQVCIDGTDWCCPEEDPNCMDEGTGDDDDIDIDIPTDDDDDDDTTSPPTIPDPDDVDLDLPGDLEDEVDDVIDRVTDDSAVRVNTGLVVPMIVGVGLMALL